MASYRLLQPHWINDAFLDANTIATDTGASANIPVGWKPTLASEPLDAGGLAAFYAQPPGRPPLIQSQFQTNVVAPPKTFWLGTPHAGGCTSWQLQGLGASLAPILA